MTWDHIYTLFPLRTLHEWKGELASGVEVNGPQDRGQLTAG